MRIPRPIYRRLPGSAKTGIRWGRKGLRLLPRRARPFAVVALLGACAAPIAAVGQDTATTVTSMVEQVTVPSFAPPSTATEKQNPEQLAALLIDDTRPPGGYDRGAFPHWLDLDGNGCDARDDALAAESAADGSPVPCNNLTGGRWVSDYDGAVLGQSRLVDVDHLVPLHEAWRSGAHAWTTDQRAVFANAPENLWAVSASSNRAKSDRDPALWRPPAEGVWCTYAQRWLSVKVTYGLTADTAERDALGRMLAACR